MENSINSDIIRGHIDTIILRTISPEDKNSQEIMDEISYKSDGKYELKQATLYSALKRLENDKFLKAYWKDCSDGGRRRYYHLTDKGQTLINKNLSDWMFSRAIIDTLVQADPYNTVFFKGSLPPVTNETPIQQPIQQPVQQVVEQTVVSPIEKPVVETNQEAIKVVEVEKQVVTPVVENQTVENKDVKNADEYTQELNFRYILNGLIKSSVLETKSTPVVTDVPNEQTEPQLITEQLKENRASFSYEISKQNNVKDNPSDFSDLVEECERSNVKIRVSMNRQHKIHTGILINHVKLLSSVLIYVLFALEVLILTLSNPDIVPSWALSFIAVGLIFPLICYFNYKKDPNKTIYRYLSAKDVILESFAILFGIALLNVLLFVFFAGALPATVSQTLYLLVMPLLLYLDCFVYFIIRSTIISNSRFKVSGKTIDY